MRSLLLGLLVIAACSKADQADECQRVMAKSKAVLGEMARMRGIEIDAKGEAKLVEQCRAALKKGKRDPAMDCVLAAKDDAGVRDCYLKGFESYQQRSKAIRDGKPPVGDAPAPTGEPGSGSAHGTHP